MLLEDHKNDLAKCLFAAVFSMLFIMGGFKSGHISSEENIVQSNYKMFAASKAYFNPVTGRFEAPPKSDITEPDSLENASENSIQAKSFNQANQSASYTTEVDEAESAPASEVTEYKGAKIFAIPTHMRSRLMATRSFQDGSLKISHQAPSIRHEVK